MKETFIQLKLKHYKLLVSLVQITVVVLYERNKMVTTKMKEVWKMPRNFSLFLSLSLSRRFTVHIESDYSSSVQFTRSVVSDSLWSHRLHHGRLPGPSPTPRACSNSCPSSRWCHPTISSSVVPFSFCLQSFPASGSFPRCQLFTSGSQSIGASGLASVWIILRYPKITKPVLTVSQS